MLGYTKAGHGPESVIALSDWMSTHESFDDLQKYLDHERFTYIFPDHRGYGESRSIRGKHTLMEATVDVLELADSLDIQRFHLLAHSMSGMIGQRISVDAPERLRSLTLVTPVTAQGMPLDGDGKQLFEGAVHSDELWLTVAKAVTGDRLSDAFYQRKLRQHRDSVEPAAFGGFLTMWTTTNFAEEMNNLQTPTLIVVGAHDFPAFTSEAYEGTLRKWYRNTKMEVFRDAGHYPMSESPPRFAQLVEHFFASQD